MKLALCLTEEQGQTSALVLLYQKRRQIHKILVVCNRGTQSWKQKRSELLSIRLPWNEIHVSIA